ncbi:hypothetical protein WMY93_024886 [Mugilogobius chulae]|uniref:GOLD domain-containing protein n=1 Tax=Mugilogobius chulae TaxID=88201 RepID=A0AAW0NDE2_9GOBI
MELSRRGFRVLIVLLFLVLEKFAVLAGFSQSMDSDFTFTLPPGRKECFFQTMKKDASLEIEYQVLDGAGLDVDFYIASPTGQILFNDYRKSDGVHTVETEDGDYMFCFDNTFSAVSEKIVFFELILDNMDTDEDPNDWKEYVHGTDMLDMKLEDIMDTINNVKARLSKSVHIQTALRAFEARDRNLQESNFERVNFWSTTNVIVMHKSEPKEQKRPFQRMGPDSEAGPSVPWRKVLWERQPFPDNYVDQRFLEELRRNEGLHQYHYWAVVKEASIVGQQLSCVALFITLWLYMEQGLLPPETLLWTSLLAALLGYGLYQLLSSKQNLTPSHGHTWQIYKLSPPSSLSLNAALFASKMRERTPHHFTVVCLGVCVGGVAGLGSQSSFGAVLLT